MNKIYVAFVLAAGLVIAGRTQADLKNMNNELDNSLSKSFSSGNNATAGNNATSAANAIATNTNSSTEGLVPVGPVTSPGCSGIEVVGYGQANNAPAAFPSSNTVPTGFSTTPIGGKLTVASLSGSAIVTNDFIHNGVTIPDAANNGSYLLAGNLGYCITDPQKCQAGTTTDFNVFYDSTVGSFTIALLKEPLGRVRLKAERFLMQTLGIAQGDMCRLNYYVGTTMYVNPHYDSKNLGFSFCPGATVLPQ
jgi:hypothetical protein